MKTPLLPILFLALIAPLRAADTTAIATNAIDALGIDLLAKTGKPDENAVLSPYSIQTGLAMAYAGADGKTREEMAKVLHFPKDNAELADSFAELRKMIGYVATDHSLNADKNELTFITVNRLYTSKGHAFRKDFLSLIDRYYDATPIAVDFKNISDAAIREINADVARDTHGRVLDAIPPGVVDSQTSMILLNAIYMKANWKFPFGGTKPAPFYARGVEKEDVNTMYRGIYGGYAKRKGYEVVAIEYSASNLQFVVLLPDERRGLAALEANLTPRMLTECTHLDHGRIVKLWMPKFQIDPTSLPLEIELKQLGMKTAFDEPKSSANFDGVAPRKPDDYLYISDVFHKTWLSLDEQGTEAVAVSEGFMAPFGTGRIPTPPPEVSVHVDHPFLFVIQQCDTGACLFIGRVTEPEFRKPSGQITFPEYFKYRKRQTSPTPGP